MRPSQSRDSASTAVARQKKASDERHSSYRTGQLLTMRGVLVSYASRKLALSLCLLPSQYARREVTCIYDEIGIDDRCCDR